MPGRACGASRAHSTAPQRARGRSCCSAECTREATRAPLARRDAAWTAATCKATRARRHVAARRTSPRGRSATPARTRDDGRRPGGRRVRVLAVAAELRLAAVAGAARPTASRPPATPSTAPVPCRCAQAFDFETQGDGASQAPVRRARDAHETDGQLTARPPRRTTTSSTSTMPSPRRALRPTARVPTSASSMACRPSRRTRMQTSRR